MKKFTCLVSFLFAVGIHSSLHAEEAIAIFAGGCFWCTEADFEKLPGVLSAESGYTDGEIKNPNYKEVSAGSTGHTEAVRVTYDNTKVSYAQLVDYFWRHIDPTVKDQQFCDKGTQYRSAIFYQNETELAIINNSIKILEESKKIEKIVTEVSPVSDFYLAEDYHQDYYKKNPVRYNFYRKGCGRDQRLKEIWGE